MKRKIICFTLILFILFAMIPSSAFAGTGGKWGENISWELSDGILTISGNGDMKKSDPDEIVPWTYLDGIEKIVIKEGITSIPDFAFFGIIDDEGIFCGAANAENIQIPASVNFIGEYAFMFCEKLEAVNVSSSNENYSSDSQGVLYNKEQTSLIYVPDGYSGEIIIPKTVNDIRTETFDLAYHIGKISVDENNLTYSSDLQGGLYDKEMRELFVVPKGYEGKFEIPYGVTHIGTMVFHGCADLTEVKLPEGISSIPDYAFYMCSNLKTVHIPKTVTVVSEGAFGECEKIKDVYFGGNRFEWESISFSPDNTFLTDAQIHYTCEHLSAEEIQPATCTEAAVIYCGECNKNYETGEPLGHSFGEWIEENGQKEKICSRCAEIRKYIKGDVNFDGNVNALDATQILRFINGKSSVMTDMTEEEKIILSDVNKDGYINALDATQILRYANNKSSVLSGMEEAERISRADVNGDGKINALDATQMLRYANNKSSVLGN